MVSQSKLLRPCHPIAVACASMPTPDPFKFAVQICKKRFSSLDVGLHRCAHSLITQDETVSQLDAYGLADSARRQRGRLLWDKVNTPRKHALTRYGSYTKASISGLDDSTICDLPTASLPPSRM